MIKGNIKIDQANGLRTLFKNNIPAHKPLVTAVAGSKGGVGKTTLALNLALTLKDSGKRVLLLDANFGMGHIEILLGIDAPLTLADVVLNGASVMETITKVDNNFSVIPSGFGEQALVYAHPVALEGLLIEAEKCARGYDHFIIDTRSGLGEGTLQALKMADRIMLVTTPESLSLAEAYQTIKFARNNDPKKVIHVAINRVDNEREAKRTFGQLQKITKSFLGYDLKYAGFITEDKTNVGRVCLAVKNIASNLDESIVPEKKGVWMGFLSAVGA